MAGGRVQYMTHVITENAISVGDTYPPERLCVSSIADQLAGLRPAAYGPWVDFCLLKALEAVAGFEPALLALQASP